MEAGLWGKTISEEHSYNNNSENIRSVLEHEK